ncbi:hypothetical protein IHE45_04G013200 [Dioscorea alata]|uniref:Uncharacterized protein n=2 Tax=Dioscorea alata TaxID=55571 RepID=A0ACB7WAF7_DIOAL|nr:hypothetical protein IHE45_04G013200 [Dioscorea alata]
MEFGDSEEVLKALDNCLSRIKWRLRPSAKRRLEIDILSLLTGLRPVVMVDYGGKMPELGEHLCALLHLARKMILHSEQSAATLELVAIQKKFASLLPSNEDNAGPSLPKVPISTPKVESSDCDPHGYTNAGESSGFESSEPIDLSDIVKDTKITVPTLNGWLLGYPVVYLFSKDHVADAVYNLSTKYLHIYKILVCRKETSGRKSSEEELMSFTVPYELSLRADKEPWAETFLTCISAKLESCRRVWMRLRMEVSECYPQAIVL